MASAAADNAHAARMDAIYRTQRHFYDLTRKYYLLGRDRLIRELAPAPGARVLEIGCGTGRNLVAVARAYPEAQLFGFDISTAMLDSAARAVQRAGIADRVTLACADATAFDAEALFGVSGFDRIFCSYTLSMIPGWEQAIAAGLAALDRDGAMHIVDFGDQHALPGWFRNGLHAWLARFHVSPRETLGDKAAAIAGAIGLRAHHQSLYRGYAQMAVLHR